MRNAIEIYLDLYTFENISDSITCRLCLADIFVVRKFSQNILKADCSLHFSCSVLLLKLQILFKHYQESW